MAAERLGRPGTGADARSGMGRRAGGLRERRGWDLAARACWMIVSLVAIGCAAPRPAPSATAGYTEGSPEPRDIVKVTALTVFPEPVDVVVPQSEYRRSAIRVSQGGIGT